MSKNNNVEKTMPSIYLESLHNHVLLGFMQGYLTALPYATQMEAADAFAKCFRIDEKTGTLPITYNRVHKKYVDSIKENDGK